MKLIGLKLTEVQIKAVDAAFIDSADDLKPVDKVRILMAEALAARGIDFPATPSQGGKRPGAGKPRKR